MIKGSVKKRILLKLIILLITFLVVLFAVLIPYFKKIKKLQTSIEASQQELEENFAKTQHLRKSSKEFNEISETINQYSNITIKEGDEIDIITQLEELAIKNNIDQKLDLKDSKNNTDPDTDLPYYTFSFRNRGSFENQINYLKDLELLPYYVVIKSINWQRGGGDNYNADVIANFDGIIYVF